MFYDVSQCFMMYHNVLHVFHDVLLCLTMFYDVRHATIGDRVAADRLRDRDNAAEIGDGAAGIVDIAANVIPC